MGEKSKKTIKLEGEIKEALDLYGNLGKISEVYGVSKPVVYQVMKRYAAKSEIPYESLLSKPESKERVNNCQVKNGKEKLSSKIQETSSNSNKLFDEYSYEELLENRNKASELSKTLKKLDKKLKKLADCTEKQPQ